MHAYGHGRHEHGQNFLTDSQVIDSLVRVIAQTSGPIIEIGPGSGSLTIPMSLLGRPITAVEIDPHMVKNLKRNEKMREVEIVCEDFLRFRLPQKPHTVVGNIPFHLTTSILRKLFRAPGWTTSVLLMQWEVARRRAGIGSMTMMTAQWGPWFSFSLGERVPRSSFEPQPNVDGGVLIATRIEQPQISVKEQKAFQAMIHSVFTGRGHGLGEILVRNGLFTSKKKAQQWLLSRGISPKALPPQLSQRDWIDLHQHSGAEYSQKPRRGKERRTSTRRNARRN